MVAERLRKALGMALAAALAVALCGCSGKVNITTEVQLSPRGQAVITLDPDSRNQIELRNRGPGFVQASAYDADSLIDAEITLGPHGHYSDSLRGIGAVTLRNLSGYRTTVALDLQHAKSYELTLREPDAGAHHFE